MEGHNVRLQIKSLERRAEIDRPTRSIVKIVREWLEKGQNSHEISSILKE